MINQEKKSSGPIVVGGAVYMGETPQNLDAKVRKIADKMMQRISERDYCHNYMRALANLLDRDVREVEEWIMWFASTSDMNDYINNNRRLRDDWIKAKAALAAGGKDG